MPLDPITAGLDLASTIINKIWPDHTQQDAAKLDLLKAEMANQFALQLGQIQVNTAEAGSSSIFVAGARPFIMWVCGVALAYQYLIRTILPWVCAVVGHPVPPLPGLDQNLWELTAGMLGMAGWRSWDKKNGTTT